MMMIILNNLEIFPSTKKWVKICITTRGLYTGAISSAFMSRVLKVTFRDF